MKWKDKLCLLYLNVKGGHRKASGEANVQEGELSSVVKIDVEQGLIKSYLNYSWHHNLWLNCCKMVLFIGGFHACHVPSFIQMPASLTKMIYQTAFYIWIIRDR